MALCRCKEHPPKRRKRIYTHFVEPIGFPNTSSICGANTCHASGYVWLESTEYNALLHGERIFTYPTAVTKVKVSGKKPHSRPQKIKFKNK